MNVPEKKLETKQLVMMAIVGITLVSFILARVTFDNSPAIGIVGAIEGAFSALSLHEQVIPPTINLDALDPSCPVNCVRVATSSNFDFVLANSWGFGGSASCIVFGRV